MKFLKDILSEIKHINSTLKEASVEETQARLETLEKTIGSLYDGVKIVTPDEFIEEKSLEELFAIIVDGQKYSPEAIEVLQHLYRHEKNEKDILCAAYKVLSDVDFKINENETEYEIEHRREQVCSAMNDYAYQNSLNWDGKNFWMPSNC